MSDPLLTIAIPTYNRAGFLAKCLESAFAQLVPGDPRVEVMVSDNCSSDSTPKVVRGFTFRHPHLRGVRNPSNIGPDANFLQCFRLARGRYVLLLGDDDYLLPGAVDAILRAIASGNHGVVAFRGITLRRLAATPPPPAGDLRVWEGTGERFLTLLGYEPTFISTNVVRREGVADWVDFSPFVGTYLNQLSWTIPAIFRAPTCLFIDAPLIAASEDDRGGQAFIETMVSRQTRVLAMLEPYGLKPAVARKFMRMRLYYFFPHIVYRMKTRTLTRNVGYHTEDVPAAMGSYFCGHWYFTLFLLPLIKAPRFLTLPIFLACYLVEKAYRGWRRVGFLARSRALRKRVE